MSDGSVVDVTGWEVSLPEPGGSEANTWLLDPDGGQALFKPVVAKDGRRQGEDWAEKAVEQIARTLDVPCARIRMAVRAGRPGLLSDDLVEPGYELRAWALLIGTIDNRLVPRSRERLGHNLDNIERVLRPLPARGMPTGFTAFDQFCGYLMLDALVANRDRHEENWAVLRSPGGDLSLAPSFDHGNSLGFNLEDSRRWSEFDRDPLLAHWARRGRADRFEGGRPLSLAEFAALAAARSTAGATKSGTAGLPELTMSLGHRGLSHTAEMSDAARRFSLQLLITNRRRLLDD